MTTTRMLAIVAGAGLALVAAVGFLYSISKDVGPFGAHHTRTETRVVTDSVRSLVLETDAGSVEIVRGPRLVLRETTSYRGSGAAPHADHQLADGELKVKSPTATTATRASASSCPPGSPCARRATPATSPARTSTCPSCGCARTPAT